MTELRLDEVIVDALVAKLQAGWPDRIGQINAEKNDLILEPPHNEMYFVGRMLELPATPACFVLSTGGTFRESGSHSMSSVYEINVHIIESGASGPELARRLMRQARSVIEVVYDDDPMEALYVSGSTDVKSAFRIFPLRVVPGAVFEPAGMDAWRGSYMIVFRAEQEEM